MKKIVSLLVTALVAMCVMTSCASKEEKALSKLDALLEHVVKDGDTMSEEEWDQVYTDYQAIGLDNEELEFTDEQLKEVGTKTAKILKEYGDHTQKKIGKKLQDSLKKLGGFLKGLSSDDEE